MATDTLVSVDSFDEAVRRIMDVVRQPTSHHISDMSAALTELQIRRCLDELLCCYELQTQELLCGERLHHKRLRRSHESSRHRADLTSLQVVCDTTEADKDSVADRSSGPQLRAQAELERTEQELAGRERDIQDRRRDMDVLDHKLQSREEAMSQRECAVQARASDLDERERHVAVHELMLEEDQRLLAAQREALEHDRKQHAQQGAQCADARRKLRENTEDLATHQPSVRNLESAMARLPQPSAPPKADAQAAVVHHSQSFVSTTRSAHGDSSLVAASQDFNETARKRNDDNDRAAMSLVPGPRPAPSIHRHRGGSSAGQSSNNHVAEPQRATSAFARFAAPLTRLLVSGEEPTLPG